jgi:tRNA(Arg) A34 adenosine deaminase TadA
MSAAIKAGINSFYFGAPCEKSEDPHLTVFAVAKKSKHKIRIETGILKEECAEQVARGRSKL